MLNHNKDEIEFVTEFPCLLGHLICAIIAKNFICRQITYLYTNSKFILLHAMVWKYSRVFIVIVDIKRIIYTVCAKCHRVYIAIKLIFILLCTETISRNKCGTKTYFFPLQRFGPSPSPNLKQTCIQRQFLTKFGQALPKFN